jgi:hypothetical protein
MGAPPSGLTIGKRAVNHTSRVLMKSVGSISVPQALFRKGIVCTTSPLLGPMQKALPARTCPSYYLNDLCRIAIALQSTGAGAAGGSTKASQTLKPDGRSSAQALCVFAQILRSRKHHRVIREPQTSQAAMSARCHARDKRPALRFHSAAEHQSATSQSVAL